MPDVIPPYADPGLASFETLDTYKQNYLLAGSHPEVVTAIGLPMANNTSFEQFSVVGIDASGKVALATYVAAAAATGVLTFSGTGSGDETVVIGGVTYTLKADPSAAYEVDIGADAAGSAANLAAAINASGTAGTTYGSGTLAHPEVTASVDGAAVTVTARNPGAAANFIATTETSAEASWGSATLTGGLDKGGVRARYVLAHAASLGASGSGNAQGWYQGNFNQDALVWDASFDSDAKKQAAFNGAPTPTAILINKRS
jgi:hypothetical protein